MKYRLLCVIIFFSLPIFSQGFNSLNYINNLGGKKVATFEDGVAMFMFELGQNSAAFNYNKGVLDKAGITVKMKYTKDQPLRRGILSKMIARYLNIKDSLFYLIFRTERYAFRACASRGLMDPNNSEWDKLSGEELIEIMSKVSEIKNEQKK